MNALLLHPGGWPRDEGFHAWHMFVQVRAMENSIYIMSTNWGGHYFYKGGIIDDGCYHKIYRCQKRRGTR